MTKLILPSAGIQTDHLLWRLRNGGCPRRQPPVQLLYIGAGDLDSAFGGRGEAGAVAAAPAIVSRYVNITNCNVASLNTLSCSIGLDSAYGGRGEAGAVAAAPGIVARCLTTLHHGRSAMVCDAVSSYDL